MRYQYLMLISLISVQSLAWSMSSDNLVPIITADSELFERTTLISRSMVERIEPLVMFLSHNPHIDLRSEEEKCVAEAIRTNQPYDLPKDRSLITQEALTLVCSCLDIAATFPPYLPLEERVVALRNYIHGHASADNMLIFFRTLDFLMIPDISVVKAFAHEAVPLVMQDIAKQEQAKEEGGCIPAEQHLLGNLLLMVGEKTLLFKEFSRAWMFHR